MQIVFGLGNPGAEYEKTRHNIGFRVVQHLAGIHRTQISIFRFQSLIGKVRIREQPVLLAMPQTYMNSCGPALRRLLEEYGETPASALIVCDDFHLPLGQIRIRRRGSSGGHRGLMSIGSALATESFPRLRVGIGPLGKEDTQEFVLEAFPAREKKEVETAVESAVQAVEVWIEAGIETAMNRFNTRRAEESQ